MSSTNTNIRDTKKSNNRGADRTMGKRRVSLALFALCLLTGCGAEETIEVEEKVVGEETPAEKPVAEKPISEEPKPEPEKKKGEKPRVSATLGFFSFFSGFGSSDIGFSAGVSSPTTSSSTSIGSSALQPVSRHRANRAKLTLLFPIVLSAPLLFDFFVPRILVFVELIQCLFYGLMGSFVVRFGFLEDIQPALQISYHMIHPYHPFLRVKGFRQIITVMIFPRVSSYIKPSLC